MSIILFEDGIRQNQRFEVIIRILFMSPFFCLMFQKRNKRHYFFFIYVNIRLTDFFIFFVGSYCWGND